MKPTLPINIFGTREGICAKGKRKFEVNEAVASKFKDKTFANR